MAAISGTRKKLGLIFVQKRSSVSKYSAVELKLLNKDGHAPPKPSVTVYTVVLCQLEALSFQNIAQKYFKKKNNYIFDTTCQRNL